MRIILKSVVVLATVFSTTSYRPSHVYARTHQRAVEEQNYGVARIDIHHQHRWRRVRVRVTYYCPSCNSPRGSHQSASGVRLREGHVAYNGAPLGSTIKVNGKEYKVVDRCGIPNTVDIFKETRTCQCSGCYYTTAYIKEK